MWDVSLAMARQSGLAKQSSLQRRLEELVSGGSPAREVSELSPPVDMVKMQGAGFDLDKSVGCNVEAGHTLVHGAGDQGGRGYGLGTFPITSGCYQWKVRLFATSFYHSLGFICRPL